MKKLITLFALLLCISVTAQSNQLTALDAQKNTIIESTVSDLKSTDTALESKITTEINKLKTDLTTKIDAIKVGEPVSSKIYYVSIKTENFTVSEEDLRNMRPFIIDAALKNVKITLPNLELEPNEIVYFNYKFEADEQANSFYTIDGKTWEVWKKINFVPTSTSVTIKN